MGRGHYQAWLWPTAVSSGRRLLLALAILTAMLAAPTADAKPLPVKHFRLPAGMSTSSLTVGPDGAIWFAGYPYEASPEVGRLTAGGGIMTFDIPGLQTGRLGWPTLGAITSAEDNLWFTLYGWSGAAIGRITTGGEVRLFPLPRKASFPYAIVPGRGGRLWFTMGAARQHRPSISAIDQQGRVVEYPLPKNQALALTGEELTVGPDGNVWFLARGRSTYPHTGLIGRITPRGAIKEFRVPGGEGVSAIAVADGAVWFADESAIGRVSMDGKVVTYPLPTPDAATPYVDTLAAAPNGDLWFTDNPPAGLGRITPSGEISFAPMQTENDTHSSLVSNGGYLWFNEREDIARVRPRLVGPRLSQIGSVGLNSPGSFRLSCGQLAQSCSGTLRIQIQPWRLGGPHPQRLLSVPYHLSQGATKSFRLQLNTADLMQTRAARREGVPVTVGAYERGGYATGSSLRISK